MNNNQKIINRIKRQIKNIDIQKEFIISDLHLLDDDINNINLIDYESKQSDYDSILLIDRQIKKLENKLVCLISHKCYLNEKLFFMSI